MKIRYQEIEVHMERSESRVTITVPEWEVPIVQAVHPDTQVKRNVCFDVPTLSVSAEYGRLADAYGAEREEGGKVGGPYIATVYGDKSQGIAALKKAMQGAVLPASTPVTPLEYSPPLNQDLLDSLEGGADDLIGSLTEEPEDAIT